MIYKATEVAAYVVKTAGDFGDDITPLRLQKILYYIQGAFLALKGEPAFSDEILAWKHGPAIHSVYSEYKKYGGDSIISNANYSSISESDQLFIKETYNRYRTFSTTQLINKTHDEPPWANSTENDVITTESIRSFFANIVYNENNLLSNIPLVTKLPNDMYDPSEDEEWSQYK